jgi:molybdopterin/thiamine biosynthesis adenylyltransferase
LLLERADSVRPASYLAAAGVGHIAIVDADTVDDPTCNEKSLMERRRLELQSVNRPNG